jgi:3-isopropylmalate/(R)-2-methylmalate dehydratase small subunit
MDKFKTYTSVVIPMDRANVDTDMILPKQFLKSIKRTGFGPNLFDELRYEDVGIPDADTSHRPIKKDFVLNLPEYKDGKILIARENFGSGSSREHAPWAIKGFGIDVVIAPSFADIFFNNSFKNGILLITLDSEIVDDIFKELYAEKGYQLTIDLKNQKIIKGSGEEIDFEVDQFRKHCLLEGLDDIGLTLQHEQEIKDFEKEYKKKNPWLFKD